MRQKLLHLHEIQKIDLEIREIEKRRDALADRLKQLGESVHTIRSEVDVLTEQRQTVNREVKTLEGTVAAEAIKIRKWEARLTDIRNQREYLALSREVETSKRANREAEEKILELMTSRETIEKTLDGLQDKLAEEEVDLGTERGTIEHDIQEAETRITTERQRRDELLPKVPKNLLKKYDAIRQKRLGIGLVPVVGGCCQGCNMRLPPQLYNVLQRGDTLEQCPSCQRIIFWDQLLAADEAQSSSEEKKGVEAAP